MEEQKRRKIILWTIVGVIFIGLMIVASVYDLDISKKIADLKPGVYQSKNTLGSIFETIGEMPVYLMLIFASSIIFADFYRRGKKISFIIIVIIFEVISLFVGYYAFHKFFKYLNIHFEFTERTDYTAEIANLFLSGLLLFGINILSKKYSNEFLNATLPWAFIVITAIALSQFITQIAIKLPAGRYRFCTLNTLNDYSLYTKWFIFNGRITPTPEMMALGVAKDGMKSFPSGHSCAAASLFALTILPDYIARLNTKKYKIVCWSATSIYVIVTMFSRIVMGKHYLSDVLIGAAITVLCLYICNHFGKNIYNKYFKLENLHKINPVIVEEKV